MRKSGKRTSLFIKLLYGYILFGVILFLSIGVSIIYMYSAYQGTVEDGKVISIDSKEILNDDMTLKNNIIYLTSNESWLELLDKDGNVVDVKGEKKDTSMHYEMKELNKVQYRGQASYYADILTFYDSKGNVRYCLVKYAKDVVSFKVEFTSKEKYLIITNEQGISINGIIQKGILLFILLCILDAVMLSYWINRKVKIPLDFIGKGFGEISKGNLDVQLDFVAEKEFEIIEERFNSMVSILKHSILEKDKAEQSKKLMLLNLSHDIKTPLATIKGYITALDEGYVIEEKKIKHYYHTILLKTERISDLIDELFDLLKIENKKYEINLSEIDIFEFLRQTIAEYYSEIEENEMELELNIPEIECKKKINLILMKRTIENLLFNAIKYSGKNTKIIVSSSEEKGRVCIAIQDEGQGIPDEIKETLFEPFVLGDSARQTCGGNGLGLAIVKAIVERHNGEIKYVETEIGARFEILI